MVQNSSHTEQSIDAQKLIDDFLESNASQDEKISKLIELAQDDIAVVDSGEYDHQDAYDQSRKITNNKQSGGVGSYLREAGNHEVLNSKQEAELSRRIHDGRSIIRKTIYLTHRAAQGYIDEVWPIINGEKHPKELLKIDSNHRVSDEEKEEIAQKHSSMRNRMIHYRTQLEKAAESGGELAEHQKSIRNVLNDIDLKYEVVKQWAKDFLNDNDTVLSGAERLKIKNCIQYGFAQYKQAHERLMVHNLRLVVNIAKQYSGYGLNIDDLVQEGNIGLAEAADRFDGKLGYKFSTYATWWIKQAMTRALNEKSSVIRIPTHTMEQVNRVNEAVREFVKNNGREPRPEELEDSLNWSVDKIKRLLRVSRDPVSLNETADGSDDERMDTVENENAETPDSIEEQTNLNQILNKAIGKLDYRAKQVVRMRYGLDSQESRTLEEIGDCFNVTRERIRQIENEALESIRENAPELADFLPQAKKVK